MTTALTVKERFNATVDRVQLPAARLFGGDETKAGIFLTAVQVAATNNPKILQCSPTSLVKAMLKCAALQLMPDDGQDHVHLIPYNGELQVQLGFRGLIELTERSGKVRKLEADVVYQDEIDRKLFSFRRSPFAVRHEGALDARRSNPEELRAAYAWVELRSGGVVGVVLTRDEVLKAKSKAQGTSRSDSPWKQWPDRMWRKTAIKALINSGKVPKSPRQVMALEMEAGIEPALEIPVDEGLPSVAELVPDVSDLEPAGGE